MGHGGQRELLHAVIGDVEAVAEQQGGHNAQGGVGQLLFCRKFWCEVRRHIRFRCRVMRRFRCRAGFHIRFRGRCRTGDWFLRPCALRQNIQGARTQGFTQLPQNGRRAGNGKLIPAAPRPYPPVYALIAPVLAAVPRAGVQEAAHGLDALGQRNLLARANTRQVGGHGRIPCPYGAARQGNGFSVVAQAAHIIQNNLQTLLQGRLHGMHGAGDAYLFARVHERGSGRGAMQGKVRRAYARKQGQKHGGSRGECEAEGCRGRRSAMQGPQAGPEKKRARHKGGHGKSHGPYAAQPCQHSQLPRKQGRQAWPNVRRDVRRSVWPNVRSNVWPNVWSNVRRGVRPNVWRGVRYDSRFGSRTVPLGVCWLHGAALIILPLPACALCGHPRG